MDEQNMFGGVQSASPWVVNVPNAKLVAQQMKQAKLNELLAKADALAPDYSKLMSVIKDYDIDPASSAQVSSQLQSQVSDFYQKYNQNPFYVFTREGKDKLKQLQYFVNDPKLNYAQNAFKLSQEEYKKESDKGTLPFYNYDSGRLKARNIKTGAVEQVNAFNLNLDEYEPLTGATEYQYLTSGRGFIKGEKPFAMNMSKLEDVRNSVNTFLASNGYIKDEKITELYNITTKDNAANISRKANLLQDILSPQERNTILGQYVTDKINSGGKPNKEEASKYFINFIKDIAESQVVQETSYSPSTALQVSGMLKEQTTPMSQIESDLTGATQRPQKTYPVRFGGKESALPYFQVSPARLFEKSAQTVKIREDESPVPKRNFADLYVTSTIGANNMYIPALQGDRAGQLVPIPAGMRKVFSEIVANPGFAGATAITDAGGGFKRVIGTLNKEGETLPSSRALMLEASFQGDRDDAQYELVYSFLKSLGYEPTEVSKDEIDELRAHTASASTQDEDWWTTWGTRELWKFPVFGQYDDPNIFNEMTGIPAGYEAKSLNTSTPFPQPETSQTPTNAFIEANRRRFSSFESLNQPVNQ